MTTIHFMVELYAIAGVAISASTYGRGMFEDLGSVFTDENCKVPSWKVGALLMAVSAAAASCWPIFLCDWMLGRRLRPNTGDGLWRPIPAACQSSLLKADSEVSGLNGSAYLASLFAPTRVKRRIKPCVCPTCGHSLVSDIVYGAPEQIDIGAVQRGKIVLGGCVFSNTSPSWRCNCCGQAIKRLVS